MTAPAKPWMAQVLWAAAIYNLAWGGFVVLYPELPFRWAEMPPPNYPELWQCIGMMVGVYAYGYYLLAREPQRYAGLIWIGLAGKTLGPLGYLFSAATGSLPWTFGWVIVFNDLIWWPAFGLYCRDVARLCGGWKAFLFGE